MGEWPKPVGQTGARVGPRLALLADAVFGRYHIPVLDHEQVALRTLEIEAEMSEAQAKKFTELALNMSDSDHKKKIEALAEEATVKAVQIRLQLRLLRDPRENA